MFYKLYIISIITFIFLIIYIFCFIYKKSNEKKIKILSLEKKKIFNLEILNKINEIKKLHLIGQSQKLFRKLNEEILNIYNDDFNEIKNKIYEIEELNNNYHFLKVKNNIKKIELIIRQIKLNIKEKFEKLKKIGFSEKFNSLKIQKNINIFEDLKKFIKKNKNKFYDTYLKLEYKIKNIDNDILKFKKLNKLGDPIEAENILILIIKKIVELKKIIIKIPKLFKNLKEIFPEQIKEIENVYNILNKSKVVFEENIYLEIKKVKNCILKLTNYLKQLKLEIVEIINNDIKKMIKNLYLKIEKYLLSREYIIKNKIKIYNYINKNLKDNINLLFLFNEISLKFYISNNKLRTLKRFNLEIKELIKNYKNFEIQIKNNKTSYFLFEKFLKDCFKILNDIENSQLKIQDFFYKLQFYKKDFFNKMYKIKLKILKINFLINKQKLKKIPNNYLEFFNYIISKIKIILKLLNGKKIDIFKINELYKKCFINVEILYKKTYDLINYIKLIEEMFQISNHYYYKFDFNMKLDFKKCIELYNNCEIEDAFKNILNILNKIDVEIYKRIEKNYFLKNKKD